MLPEKIQPCFYGQYVLRKITKANTKYSLQCLLRSKRGTVFSSSHFGCLLLFELEITCSVKRCGSNMIFGCDVIATS